MGEWVFAEHRGSDVRREPNEAELFKTEQAGENEYARTDAIVREVLQNAMDARRGDEPVWVRLAIHPPNEAPPADRLAEYFGRLKAPLSGRGVSYGLDGTPDEWAGFLVCEDFGTRGLEGNPMLARDPDPMGPKQDFFWFWRNIGRSGKTGDDLGRWGLGKTVYRAASRVGCMLGLTCRASDARQLLMGQAVLSLHEHEGIEFAPEGWWCAGRSDEQVPLAIEDVDEVKRFCSEWHLTRKGEPGLSVVVPYVAQELRDSRILQAVAVHFFAPIIRGELVVEVSGPEIGHEVLNDRHLERACKKMEWNGPKRTKRHVAPPVSFAKRAFFSKDASITGNLLGVRNLPTIDENTFDGVDLALLRQRFSAGELLSLHLPIRLQKVKGPDEVGHVDVYIQRDSSGERYDSYFVREGMTITKPNSSPRRRGIRAIVAVEKGPLSSLLGDSEGPAHEDWDTSEERPNREWKNWKGRVVFLRRVVDALVEHLAPPMEKPDFDLLAEFFSVEEPTGQQRKARPDSNGETLKEITAIPTTPKWYRVTSRAGGFSVSASGDLPVPVGSALRLSVAYDLPSGNPLKHWSRFDFDFSAKPPAIRCEGQGIVPTVKKHAANILDIFVESEDFTFLATGFDRHRDLFVRVDEIDVLSEESE